MRDNHDVGARVSVIEAFLGLVRDAIDSKCLSFPANPTAAASDHYDGVCCSLQVRAARVSWNLTRTRESVDALRRATQFDFQEET